MHQRTSRNYSMTLIVILRTLIACSRLIFIAIPNVQPVTALVLIMGIVLGILFLCVGSVSYDIYHAVSTSAFLLLTSQPLIRALKQQHNRYMPSQVRAE